MSWGGVGVVPGNLVDTLKLRLDEKGGKKGRGIFFFFFFFSPCVHFPLQLKTSVSTQTHGATSRTESGGSWYATGPGPGMKGVAQLGAAALFICPDLAFAPVLLDLRE